MNVIVDKENMQNLCRICFELKPNLVSIYTQLFVGSCSCTIWEMLQIFLKQDEHKQFPLGVCYDCKVLVTKAFTLKVKYVKATEYLRNIIVPPEKQVKGIARVEDMKEKCESLDLYYSDEEKTREKSDLVSVENRAVFKRAKTKRNLHFRLVLYSCPICPKEFKTPLDLRQHAHTHTTLKSYFKGKKVPKHSVFVAFSYRRPVYSSSKQIYHCPICKIILTLENFFSHVETHKVQENFKCDKCNRVFRKSNHLNTHRVRSHLGEYPFKCKECKKGFVIKHNYDCHLLTHSTNEFPHKCEHCPKQFSNPLHLHRHSLIHTQNTTYHSKYKVNKCTCCKQSFKGELELKEHRKSCPPNKITKTNIPGIPKSKDFRCTLCPQSFYGSEGLEIHYCLKHKNNGAVKNVCTVCGKSVTNLFIHMASHVNYKPFKCHLCPKAFILKTVLTQHLLVHSGEKPFICSGCGKKFNSNYNLQVHERIHKGIKPHLCVRCGKSFLEKSYLKKHMKVHISV